MAHINLVPYGNARETAGPSGDWNFTCQHGVAEYQYNLIEACALNYVKTNNHMKTFEFISCIESNDTSTDYDSVATTCSTQVKLKNLDDILTCYKGS